MRRGSDHDRARNRLRLGIGLFVLALAAAALAHLALTRRRSWRADVAVLLATTVGTAVAVAAPYDPGEGRGTAVVAAVQGDVPGPGNDILFDHRQVTRNHVEETERLAARVEAGEVPRPAFVLWPENSTAVDPFLDYQTNRAIEDQVTALGGHKGLYSEAFYDEATFRRLYGGDDLDPVKARYDPDGRLPTLYDKAVRSR